jgi:phospholipid transport system substrate-binding protein
VIPPSLSPGSSIRLVLRRSVLRRLVLLIALVATVARVPAGFAAATGPVAEVRTTINEAAPVFADTKMPQNERDQKLRAIAEKHFDFAYMTRSAMGPHWRTLTPAQRQRLIPVVEQYVMETYLNRLQSTTVQAAGSGLQDKVTSIGPEDVLVHGEVKLPQLADPLQVGYALHRVRGGWKLYDLVVDNVSTMAAYRDQFNQTMNTAGYDKLLSDLSRPAPPANASSGPASSSPLPAS